VGVVTWAVSLIAGSAAMLLANFGAPAWVFALLLAWLATAGLPTTVAVLTVASLERLPWVGVLPIGAALVVMAVLALAAQLGACRLIAALLRRGHGSSP
jgi:hypothetical protein